MKQKMSGVTTQKLKNVISAGLGNIIADTVIKGASIFDALQGVFYIGDIAIAEGKIVGVGESYSGKQEIAGAGLFAVPGFIDAHVHIESSLMTPSRFQESVLPTGTTTAIWDPHELANVWGKAGIEWALNTTNNLLMDVFVMLPSCVPATHLETSGAKLSALDLKEFMDNPKVLGLAEFMNVPGVLYQDGIALEKLTMFSNLVRDGHAPMVSGRELNAYLCAGISTCHECTGIEEAREKLKKGLYVLIREGSCAKDAENLLPILDAMTSSIVGFCSDDRNPLDISLEGHINHIINMGLKKGIAPEILFRVASYAPSRIYGLLDRGVIAPGYNADIVLLEPTQKDNWLSGCVIRHVFKNGKVVPNKFDVIDEIPKELKNINMGEIEVGNLVLHAKANKKSVNCRVIGVIPNKIITKALTAQLPVGNKNEIMADLSQDVLKIAVVERHKATKNIGIGFVKGFGLKRGAIATSIGHDSHNITVVGTTDACMFAAINEIAKLNGGIVVVNDKGEVLASLALPLAGLMTNASPDSVAQSLLELKQAAQGLGCVLHEPFLQLSFLPLPVIPALKLTDKGLVDVIKFDFVECEIEDILC